MEVPPDREPSSARSSYAGGGTVESPNAPVAVARAASRGRLAVRSFPALLPLGGTFQMRPFYECHVYRVTRPQIKSSALANSCGL